MTQQAQPAPAPGQVYRCPCGCGQILFSVAPDGTLRVRCHRGNETILTTAWGLVRK